MRDVQFLSRKVDLFRGLQSGEIVIGSGPVPAEVSLGKTLGRFSLDYPKIKVKVIIDSAPDLLARLRKGDIDVFVADLRVIDNSAGLDIIELPRHQGYFCTRSGHPLTEKGELTVMDIFSYPLAVLWFPVEHFLAPLAGKAGINLTELMKFSGGQITCDSMKVLNDLIKNSDAVGLSTKFISSHEAHRDSISLLPLGSPEMHTNYGL